LSESQALVPAAFGLPFLLLLGNRKLGREIFFCIGVFLWGILLMKDSIQRCGWSINPSSQLILIGTAAIATCLWIVTSIQSRRFFSEWKTTLICAILFFAGLGAYLLLPVLSMTDPPVNWGYPRTVEGFFHVLSRGQFESFNPTSSFPQLLSQLRIYAEITIKEFGGFYLVVAAIPIFLLRQISSPARRWVAGMMTAWFLITLLMVTALNMDRQAAKYLKPYFAATHLILALLSGCGLMLIGAFCARPAADKSNG
jgi:hypothetical protein